MVYKLIAYIILLFRKYKYYRDRRRYADWEQLHKEELESLNRDENLQSTDGSLIIEGLRIEYLLKIEANNDYVDMP